MLRIEKIYVNGYFCEWGRGGGGRIWALAGAIVSGHEVEPMLPHV